MCEEMMTGSAMTLFLTLLHKDLLQEIRSKEILFSAVAFAFISILTFQLGLGPVTSKTPEAAAAILWIVILFAGMLGLNRSILNEKNEDCWSGLLVSPLDTRLLFVSKATSNFLWMLAVEVLLWPILAAWLNVPVLRIVVPLFAVSFLTTVGLASLGTILATIATYSRLRELLLPLLLLPLQVPLLIAAVRSTTALFDGGTLEMVIPWLKLLGAFDLLFVLLSYLCFPYLLEE